MTKNIKSTCGACGAYFEKAFFGENGQWYCSPQCLDLMGGGFGPLLPRLVYLIQSLRVGEMNPDLALTPSGHISTEYTGPNLSAIPKAGATVIMTESKIWDFPENPFNKARVNTLLVNVVPVGRGAPANLDKAAGFSRFSLIVVEEKDQPGSLSGCWDLTLYDDGSSSFWELLQMKITPEKEGPTWERVRFFGPPEKDADPHASKAV